MKKLIGLLFLGSVLIFPSCKKFEEGGKIKKAEENLVKEWAMERAYKNGNSVEVVNANPQIGEVTENWIFREDGTCTTEDGNSTLTGTWALSSNSEVLTVEITSPSSKASTQSYTIMKLTKGSDGELIWEHSIGSDNYRYEMRSSK
jgi:hypothetical protein